MIEKSKESLVVKQFREFSQFPYAAVENNTVKWYDLRLTNDGNSGFVAIVDFDDNGNIISESIGTGF